MSATKFYVDLAPHSYYKRDEDLLSDEIFRHLKPYPQVELYFVENLPNETFGYWKRVAEAVNENYKKVRGDMEGLKSIFRKPHVINAAFETGAKSILLEQALYTEEEFYEIQNLNNRAEFYDRQFDEWLRKGSFEDSLENYKNFYHCLNEATKKRDSIIAPRLLSYTEQNGIESVYTRFGLGHTNLVKMLPNVESRVFELFPNWFIGRPEKVLRQYMCQLVDFTLSRPFIETVTSAFDFVQLFDDESLLACGHNIEKEIFKSSSFPPNGDKVAEAIKKVFRSKLVEIGREEGFDPKGFIPVEWGGREYTNLESQKLI